MRIFMQFWLKLAGVAHNVLHKILFLLARTGWG
jgi:hypothetical protein